MEHNKPLTPIQQLGEFGLIEKLTAHFPKLQPSTIKAVGDDAAVINHEGYQTVVSTDLLIEGIHFDLMYTPLKHLGYKSVVVNLSDIYAMNATPTQITVSIAVSSRFYVEALEELYEGIKLACKNYTVDLVGGDTTSSPSGLIISVTAIGYAKPDEVVYRNGAKPGNLICVSGDLGAAYLGLQILEREKQIYMQHPEVQPELEGATYLVERQLKPEARHDVIRFLKDMEIKPTAMMDLSDGLSSDIFHICKQSGVGCVIQEAEVPFHNDTYHTAISMNLDPITCALHGGEDYELLFTIEAEDETKIPDDGSIAVVGYITEAGEGMMLHTKGGNKHPLKAQGWKHF